ncbi:MAG TPA: uroporphyrinogen-III synthase, partial [Kofleriaceae bacterium]|nr:uroporphyrinogen-III synthase [Kofleriaceae bacterium]
APLGIEVVAMEVTRQSATPGDAHALIAACQGGPYAATRVTSQVAARHLRFAIHHAGAYHELGPIWAVGEATRRELELEPGTTARHPDGVHTAAELARAMLATRSFAGERVLVPRAEDGRTEAIELLRAAGAIVVDVVAYRTTPLTAGDPDARAGHDALRSGRAAYCGVFAPSQVAALAGIVGPLPGLRTTFFAIGETTAAALRAAGVEPLVAAMPTPEGLAQAIALHSRPA